MYRYHNVFNLFLEMHFLNAMQRQVVMIMSFLPMSSFLEAEMNEMDPLKLEVLLEGMDSEKFYNGMLRSLQQKERKKRKAILSLSLYIEYL